jgi:hypothetical protein
MSSSHAWWVGRNRDVGSQKRAPAHLERISGQGTESVFALRATRGWGRFSLVHWYAAKRDSGRIADIRELSRTVARIGTLNGSLQESAFFVKVYYFRFARHSPRTAGFGVLGRTSIQSR